MKTLLRHGEKWTSGGSPGVYVTRVAVGGANPAEQLAHEPRIAEVALCNGYLTVTLTRDALEHVAVDVVQSGSDCVTSDALRGTTVPAPPPADLTTAQDWEQARTALAAELTATLAAKAGATLTPAQATRSVAPGARPPQGGATVREAIAYAGIDAVRFALARAKPTAPAPDPERIAPHVLGNPAYAVRYAHAAAAAVLRWAGTQPGEFRPGRLTEPGELAQHEPTLHELALHELTLLDTLSWLPERVAVAARRGRPDVFARYLETLAARTIDTMSTTGYKRAVTSENPEKLWLAAAARTGLAAGLGLLGIAAPDRI
jgi:arginyl-tRNA synthetase